MHGGVFKVPFLFLEDRTEGIFTRSTLIEATRGPNNADSELADNGVDRFACWLPLLLNIFWAVATLVE